MQRGKKNLEHATIKKSNCGRSQKITKGTDVKNHLSIFHALLDYSDDSIELVDMATMRFVDVNDGACRALGYTRE